MTPRESELAALVDACHERLARRFEVDGIVNRPCVVTLHEAALSSAEADAMQRLVALGLVRCAMARAFMRRLPEVRA